MPELPEVETMCRGLHPIVGKKIQSVSTPPCDYRPIQIRPSIAKIDEQLRGSVVTEVSRIGKRVVIHANQFALILQPKMTGLVALDEPPDPEHVRLQVTFNGRPKQLVQFWDRRGLGTVEMLRADQLQARIIDGKLGPDALQITPADFVQRLKATGRPIKVALLDQKIVAGIGNLYASEMLHLAGINPRKAASKLSNQKLTELHTQMLLVLNLAILHEGSTLSDGTYRNALNNPGNFQNMHLVYDRAGEDCLTCHQAKIRRIVQAQRSTFFCPRCQK